MFRKLWTALDNLAKSFNDLAASVTQANSQFRDRLGLDNQDSPEQLAYEPVAEPVATNSRGRRGAR